MMLHENTRLVIVSEELHNTHNTAKFWITNLPVRKNDKIVLKYDKICSKSY